MYIHIYSLLFEIILSIVTFIDIFHPKSYKLITIVHVKYIGYLYFKLKHSYKKYEF